MLHYVDCHSMLSDNLPISAFVGKLLWSNRFSLNFYFTKTYLPKFEPKSIQLVIIFKLGTNWFNITGWGEHYRGTIGAQVYTCLRYQIPLKKRLDKIIYISVMQFIFSSSREKFTTQPRPYRISACVRFCVG